jgi:hypothetical protein
MSVFWTDVRSLQRRLAVAGSLALCAALVAIKVDDGRLRTLSLLIIGTCLVDRAISKLAHELGDPALLYLKYAFAAKVVLLLAMLYGGWTPLLQLDAPGFGVDAQRYYFQAQDLAASNFDPSVLPAINYAGILYFYAGLFRVFGHNPAAPALINCFATLWASLVLLRTAYDYVPARRSWDWMLGLVTLIPEVVWFDALTSRESLCLALVTVIVLTTLRVFLPAGRGRLPRSQIVAAIIGSVALAAIRPPMLAIVASSAVVFVVLAWKRIVARPLLVAGLALTLGIVPLAASILNRAVVGSSGISFTQAIGLANAVEAARQEDFIYSERSIGMLVQSNNPVVLAFLAPVRIVIYLAAPLPSVNATLADYLAGDFSSHQEVYAGASSMLYLAVLPLALAALGCAWWARDWVTVLALQVPFWLSMIVVALGNQIIQERYRITALMGYALAIWIGARAPRVWISTAYTLWIAVLACGGVFFVVFKFFA